MSRAERTVRLGTGGARGARGVALIAVLVVLFVLMAIATPFMLSMRNHERAASVMVVQARAAQSTVAVLQAGETAVAQTDPAVDQTPQYDSLAELKVDVGGELARYGGSVNDPTGTIASVRVEDEQGKVDVNQVAPFLLQNLVAPMRLIGQLDAVEEKSLSISSTEALPDEGIVWIDGELIYYRQKTARTLLDLKRAFPTSLLTGLPRFDHPAGRPVVSYEVLSATLYPYKAWSALASAGDAGMQAAAEAFGGFATVRALKDVARFGEVSFPTERLERVESDLTTFATLPSADRFGAEARAVGAYTAQDFPLPIDVTGGRNVNAGTVVRLRSNEHPDRVEYNLVVDAREVGPARTALLLQEAPRYDYAPDEMLVAPLLRAPVNVNTCSPRVLTALLLGLKLRGSSEVIDADVAAFVVARILKARAGEGIPGEPGLARLLRDLMADETAKQIVTPAIAYLVLLNAINALDPMLETGTAPFCYRSGGTVTLEAAVSENLQAGREAAKAFAREVIAPAPGGARTTILASQLDFYEVLRASRVSRFWTTFPVNLQDFDNGNEPPLPLTSYLDYGRLPAATEAEQIAQVAAGKEPGARLRPTRADGYRDTTAKGAPRVLHCDEPQLIKATTAEKDAPPPIDDPDGWNVAERGPLSLSATEPTIDLIGSNDFVQPFCFSLWWMPGKGEGEQYIFDTGADEVSNRIFAYFDGEKLVFRVADTTFPDYGGGKTGAADWPTTMAEIRYAFDDGLAFERDVPYHLTFYSRGTKPCDLTLLVDGVPRGERAFLTPLAKNMGPLQVYSGPLSKIQGYKQGQGDFIEVLSTKLFPPEGVLRVGDELIEYTSKDDKTAKFKVVATPGQPFGGRGRRGTYADAPQSIVKQGQQQATKVVHPATSLVELYGYAAPFAQKQVPTGDSQLSDPLSRFAVAMVDPNATEAKQSITILDDQGNEINQKPTGLAATAARIPLTGLAKVSTSSSSSSSSSGAGSGDFGKAFSRNGGYALVVSSPRPPPSTKTGQVTVKVTQGGSTTTQNVTVDFGWDRDIKTTNGRLGRIEMIYYSSFDGGALTGVSRAGPSFLNSGNWQPQSNLAQGTASKIASEIASMAHDHVSRWPGNWPEKEHDPGQPIYVFPVSIKVGSTSSASTNQWAIPEMSSGGGKGKGKGSKGNKSTPSGTTRPEMVQIGLGFAGEGAGTEWIRYDALANGCFVRDNPWRLESAGELVGHYLTYLYTLKEGTPPASDAVARAVNFENIEANQDAKDEIVDALGVNSGTDGFANFESLFNDSIGLLAFRGVLATGDKDHPSGDRVLPVLRTVRGPDPDWGRPGARDFVTLVDPTSGSREEHKVNYGYCEPDAEGWAWLACHVGLDAGVDGTFVGDFWQMLQAIDPNDPDAGMKELMNQMIESRQVSRMLKFPSGELPLEVGEQVHFGGDLKGDPSPGGGTLDEIETFTPTTPADGFLTCNYVLDYFDEKNGEIWVYAFVVRDASRRKGGVAIEAINPIDTLPKDGLVLQVGHELVGCKSYRFEKVSVGEGAVDFAVFEVAEAGRGFLGSPMQTHVRGEAVREMTFLRASRLTKTLTEDANVLALGDTADFDDHGVVVVGRELVGYTRKQGQNVLFMPPWKEPGGREIGLLRGSYGSPREKHREDELAVQFPVRYLDRYREQADDPELGCLAVTLPQRRAFFKAVSWTATGETERASLVVEGRVGNTAKWTDAAGSDPDRFTFSSLGASAGQGAAQSSLVDRGREILRQGDALELRVFTRYAPGAFDSRVLEPDPGPDRGGRNDWKRAPFLKAIGVEWIANPTRLSYEEWR